MITFTVLAIVSHYGRLSGNKYEGVTYDSLDISFINTHCMVQSREGLLQSGHCALPSIGWQHMKLFGTNVLSENANAVSHEYHVSKTLIWHTYHNVVCITKR